MNDRTMDDALDYGRHVKQGGWRLGLLVARNVEKGKGHGGDRKSDQRHDRDVDPKVSAQEFGRLSGTSANRVLRHLEAWEAASAAGHVPTSAELEPGQEIELDVETLPEWGDFYSPVTGGRNTKEDRPATKAEATSVIARLPEAERAEVVAEAVAGSSAAAEAVAEHPVASARVTVAKTKQSEKAVRENRADNFEEEKDSSGWAVIKIGARANEVRTSVRMIVRDFEDAIAANEGNDELREILAGRITKLKADVILALDALVGDGVDEAISKMLEGEPR